MNVDRDTVAAQMRSAIARGLPNVAIGKDLGPAVLCGLGPSLIEDIPAIRALVDCGVTCFAVKDAVNILARHGIAAKHAVFLDALPDQVAYLDNPLAATTYLIGSASHPAVFDRLESLGRDVRLWHPWPDTKELVDLIPRGQGHVLIAGGTTSGLRTLHLASAMGYGPLYLAGYDGCIRPDGAHHANTPQRFNANVFDVWCCGRNFRVNSELADQQMTFRDSLEAWRDVMPKLIFLSDGLLAHTYHQIMAHPPGWGRAIFISGVVSFKCVDFGECAGDDFTAAVIDAATNDELFTDPVSEADLFGPSLERDHQPT